MVISGPSREFCRIPLILFFCEVKLWKYYQPQYGNLDKQRGQQTDRRIRHLSMAVSGKISKDKVSIVLI